MTLVSPAIRESAWPGDRLAEALEALGQWSGLGAAGPDNTPPVTIDDAAGDPRGEIDWIDAAAGRLGLEAEPLEAPYGRVEEMLRGAPPAIVRLPGDAPRFLALTSRGRRGLSLLGPDLVARTVAQDVVAAALRASVENEAGAVEKILEDAGIQGKRRARARSVLLGEMFPGRRVGGVWLIRPEGAAGLGAHSRESGLTRLLAGLLCAHVVQSVLWVLSWWLLGRSALEGRLDRGWMLGWGLLLITLIPIQILSTAAAGLLSIRSGALLKRRLLHGAFHLDPEDVRRQGAGQLLGRAMESEVVERMAIAGGFLSVTGAIEAILALLVLGRGAGGGLQVVALIAWLVVTAWLTFRLYRRREEWTGMRIAMTNDLVERMVGHRTRLAQEPRGTWNRDEDRSLARYLAASRRLDSTTAGLQAVVPRGWFLLGTLGLAPAFVWGAPSMGELAIGIGGVLLAVQAFHHLAGGLERCAAAVIAWRRIRPFWKAAGRRDPPGEPNRGVRSAGAEPDAMPLLDLRDIVFRYPGRPEPVLRQVALQVRRGDRILLEGPSGGGKSTLGALLAGQRVPESGLLLLDGLDRETLGSDRWRRKSVIVPQFHENHVFLGSFAFNALMGRGWPPSFEDLKEVEGICRTLGLGPLIDRMPGGILQMVGETGWQLSHGERSRLYIARALLQGPEVLILDESFAALDPETLRGTLGYVLERTPTLIVIAHP